MSPKADTFLVSNSTLPMLNGKNFPIWKTQMSSFLQSKGLYKFITERAEALKYAVRDETKSNNSEKLEKLTEDDEKTLGYIRCNINVSFLEIILDAKTAFEAWKSLEKFFAGKETYNKVFLLEQLIDGKLHESDDPVKDIQDFIRQKSEIIRRLNEIGLQVNEELQVAIILARLPDSYDTMKRIIESHNELNLVKLSAELNKEAVRRSNKRKLKEESAFTSKETRSSTKKAKSLSICEFCEHKGHEASICWFNPVVE
jgi:hypothetical protein